MVEGGIKEFFPLNGEKIRVKGEWKGLPLSSENQQMPKILKPE
jgi:hypothetical protein